MFYYVYVLQSEKDKRFYVGYTSNLKERINQHNSGSVKSTKDRRPLKLIYYEACINQTDALNKEKYLPCEIKKLIIKTLSKINNRL